MLGALLKQLLGSRGRGAPEVAATAVPRPVEEKPVDAWLRTARTEREAGEWGAAEAAYSSVLDAAPAHPEALLALANIAFLAGRHDAAVERFECYLGVEPDNLAARNILGRLHGELGNLDAAVRCYAKVIAANPEFEQVSHIALLLSAFDPALDAATRREVHEAWARKHADPLLDASFTPRPASARSNGGDAGEPGTTGEHSTMGGRAEAGGRRRVGYVSAFFCNHPIADFVAPVLRHHRRGEWEVFVYSDVPAPDAVTRDLQSLDLQWRDCHGMDDDAFARQVREDDIDVLVDLAGHNATNRLRAFARRLAPVQITGIGYAGTTGMAAMDYRLADPVADAGTDSHYSEHLLRLPRCLWCYQPPAAMPEPGPPPAGRDAPVTFISLNAAIKLTDTRLATWAALLHAVPRSMLILATVVPGSPRRRITAAFTRAGVEAGRLVFEPHLKREEFWKLYQRADIALDTWPCNGGTTTFEALWGGLPVVTLEGTEFRSRAGAAILAAAGMPELVAKSTEDYIAIATALAADRPRLAALRAGLRARLREAGLLDGPRYARELEGCYQEALKKGKRSEMIR